MSRRGRIVISIVGWLACAASETFAQQPNGDGPKWEVELHAGGVLAGDPNGARIALPAAGESFTTVNGRPSRYVSSWYFGDGAAFANEYAAGFTNIARSSRITSLDSVLTGAATGTSDSGTFGFRVARHLTPRVTAEFNVDYGPSRLELSEWALSDIEAARASFESFWIELLASANPLQFQNKVVVSATEMTDDRGEQVLATGALTVKLRRGGALVPYLTAGMGGVFNHGPAPSVTVRGSYSFLWSAGQPFGEVDTVSVRWIRPDRALVGLAGGGLTYDLSRRHGVRADVRFHISPNSLDTEISASPSTMVGTPAFAFASATTPSGQFSNNPTATAARSTLSGPTIVAFTTREGSGARIDTALTVGYYWRF